MDRKDVHTKADPVRGQEFASSLHRNFYGEFRLWKKGIQMRTTIALITVTLSATPLAAHPVHLGPYLGHDHWIAAGAIGAAIAIGLLAGLKGKRKKGGQAPAKQPATEAKA
jgi:hypothetical protein